MNTSTVDNSYNLTPYLFNNSYDSETNVNSHLNNSELNADLNAANFETTHEISNVYSDNNININYENPEGFAGVYSPSNQIYCSKFKSNSSDVDDYQKINNSNYYLNEMNTYNTYTSNAEDNKNETNNNFNSNLNTDYTTSDTNFHMADPVYATTDNYSNELYNGSYMGFGAGNYYSADAKVKYPVYNTYPANTDYSTSNNGIPIENLSINVDNKLGTGVNYYNNQYPISTQNIKNETNNFNNNSYYNQYDFDNMKNSSISGVKYQRTDNRWIARWTTAQGKRACKSFSVNIYGFDQAKMLAIQARQKGVALSGRSFCNRERQHAMKSGVGIIGIRFDKTQARWVSSYYEGGKRKFRYFTVKDYGYEQAKRNAIIWKSCHDERLLKKFNASFNYNYENDRMNPNMIYPLAFNPADNENYMIDNVNSNDMYSPNNGQDYVDPNRYNAYSTNTEYSNSSNFSNMSNFNIKDNFTSDINGNYKLMEFPQTYGDEFNANKGSVDYNSKGEYSNLLVSDYTDINVNDNYDTISTQASNTQTDDKYLIWDKDNAQTYLSPGDNIILNYNKMYQMDENDGFTNTTIGSDNGDNKSNGSFDYEEHFNQSDIDKQYVKGENEQNTSPEVTYDRKKGRWMATMIDSGGNRQTNYFPVSKHGYKKAKQLALSAITELKQN